VNADPASTFRDIPIGQIHPNRLQPRVHFDEESLGSLTASIAELGVLQPVLVRQVGEESYELVAGERRLRAAKRAGLQAIPALVRDVDEVLSLEQALVENLHRADLNPLEEAAAYQQLIEDFELTQEEVARRVGKSRSAVANTLRLFQLPPSIQKLVAEARLAAGHAKALLGTPDRAFQEALARRIVADGLSVRDAEEAVRQRNELGGGEAGAAPAAAESPTRKLREPGLLELENLLAEHLATRVQISMGPKRGKVVVDFADLEDLERIYRSMVPGT
jgi:ParB family chromosome partitioning protein